MNRSTKGINGTNCAAHFHHRELHLQLRQGCPRQDSNLRTRPEAGAQRPLQLPEHAPDTDRLSPATSGCPGAPEFIPRAAPRMHDLPMRQFAEELPYGAAWTNLRYPAPGSGAAAHMPDLDRTSGFIRSRARRLTIAVYWSARQTAVAPPSTTNRAPVAYSDSSEARNTMIPSTSLGVPARPSGTVESRADRASRSSAMACTRGVSV
jgi:hypothetical protein